MIFFKFARNVFLFGFLMVCGGLMATVTTNSTIQIHGGGWTIKSSCCKLPRGWDRIGYGRFCGYVFGGIRNCNSNEMAKVEGSVNFLLEGRRSLSPQRRNSYSILEIFELETLWLEKKSRRLARVELTSREIPLVEIDNHMIEIKDAVDYGLALNLIPIEPYESVCGYKASSDCQIALYEAEDTLFKVSLTIFKATNSTARVKIIVTSKRVLTNLSCKLTVTPSESDVQVEVNDL